MYDGRRRLSHIDRARRFRGTLVRRTRGDRRRARAHGRDSHLHSLLSPRDGFLRALRQHAGKSDVAQDGSGRLTGATGQGARKDGEARRADRMQRRRAIPRTVRSMIDRRARRSISPLARRSFAARRDLEREFLNRTFCFRRSLNLSRARLRSKSDRADVVERNWCRNPCPDRPSQNSLLLDGFVNTVGAG